MANKESNATYSKGEWYLQKYTDAYTNIIRCNNGKGHETVFIASTPQSTLPEARANAKLMSAAPDLLESLQEIVAITDCNHAIWVKAKAAIEKAIGNMPGSDKQPVEQKENETVIKWFFDNRKGLVHVGSLEQLRELYIEYQKQKDGNKA